MMHAAALIELSLRDAHQEPHCTTVLNLIDENVSGVGFMLFYLVYQYKRTILTDV